MLPLPWGTTWLMNFSKAREGKAFQLHFPEFSESLFCRDEFKRADGLRIERDFLAGLILTELGLKLN